VGPTDPQSESLPGLFSRFRHMIVSERSKNSSLDGGWSDLCPFSREGKTTVRHAEVSAEVGTTPSVSSVGIMAARASVVAS
jgi:hypothetical protein